jgi:hypothetical protein
VAALNAALDARARDDGGVDDGAIACLAGTYGLVPLRAGDGYRPWARPAPDMPGTSDLVVVMADGDANRRFRGRECGLALDSILRRATRLELALGSGARMVIWATSAGWWGSGPHGMGLVGPCPERDAVLRRLWSP